ncbi:MAG TPA: acyl carrier protein, partial [Sphingomicrobium sp.]|nr:acyl carrier protein [Sphingomicrobium sp.]
MTDRNATATRVMALIEPFNKKGVEVTDATRFAQDLEWDSLTVLDFV